MCGWWGRKMALPLWETVWRSPESETLLPYDPAITPGYICPRELKTYIHTKTYTQIFLAARLIIAKSPSTDEWTNKTQPSPTTEQRPGLRRKGAVTPDKKRHILSDSISRKSPEQANSQTQTHKQLPGHRGTVDRYQVSLGGG